MTSFEQALKLILSLEGGFVDHPQDPGGATNKGITQKVYDLYRLKKGKRGRSVRFIEDGEVADIYKIWYWDKVRGDELPDAVAIVTFDGAVHSGPKRALSFLCEVTGFPVVEGITPDLIMATKADPKEVALDFIRLRREHLKRLNKPVFIKGWMRRMDAVEKLVLSLI
jgi:lysozyme family protein